MVSILLHISGCSFLLPAPGLCGSFNDDTHVHLTWTCIPCRQNDAHTLRSGNRREFFPTEGLKAFRICHPTCRGAETGAGLFNITWQEEHLLLGDGTKDELQGAAAQGPQGQHCLHQARDLFFPNICLEQIHPLHTRTWCLCVWINLSGGRWKFVDRVRGVSPQPPTTKPHRVFSQGCGHPGTDRALYRALIPPSIPPEELGCVDGALR